MSYIHYEINALAPGIYAAIASEHGAAGSNSGIIDLGNDTIVFDTSSTLVAAKELYTIATELTGKIPKCVINSHSHPDHVQGNAVFSMDSVLISSAVTRAEIQKSGITEMQNMKSDINAGIELLQKQLKDPDLNESVKLELQSNLAAFHSILDGYPVETDLRLPTVTFNKSLHFHGTLHSAQLLSFGSAHSKCDSVLWLPEEKILFAGDLVIPNGNVILCLGVPENWPMVIKELETLGADTLIPGHGRVIPAKDGYSASLEYLELMFGMADGAILSGKTNEYVKQVEVPSGRNEYWFRKDLAFLIERRLWGERVTDR